MKATTIIALTLLALTKFTLAAPPPEELTKKLTDAIRKHCPDATIELTDDAFTAKHGTMLFTLHSRSKTGEVFPKTYQQEGPNFKGFMLRIALHDGRYEGAAVVPQTLQGPYFPTFIDAVPTDDGQKHYLIHFSYGSRLDPELTKAIFASLPTRPSRSSP